VLELTRNQSERLGACQPKPHLVDDMIDNRVFMAFSAGIGFHHRHRRSAGMERTLVRRRIMETLQLELELF